MIPETKVSINELKEYIQPSLTYRVDWVTNRIIGTVDGIDAVIQSVMKILMTERYANVIYNGDYGTELETLIGQDFDYVKMELKRRVTEALLMDNRINNISEFNTQMSEQNSLIVTFNISTIEGVTKIETEVTI